MISTKDDAWMDVCPRCGDEVHAASVAYGQSCGACRWDDKVALTKGRAAQREAFARALPVSRAVH